jgi:saccharopine dehydrogenase-like NADP-dependent oxidoreductase
VKTVILGGYGHFGRLVARALAGEEGIRCVIAGRDEAKAQALARELGAEGARIDADDPRLAERLVATGAQAVISTAGPFQGQDYRVAKAAIEAGAHYIDIADGRDFVCGIGALDAEARARDVLAVAGASSVPALSSAVVDRYAGTFATLEAIDIGICTSSRIPGTATVAAVLGYCGKPVPRWEDGAAGETFGWQGLRRHRFRQVDFARWLCDCDVPDLALFPGRYPGVRSVRFGAGLAPSFVHLGLWALAAMVRMGLVAGLAPRAALLASLARGLEPLGSARSAMFVRLSGTDPGGKPLRRTWELVAEGHEGANIPCMGAASLAKKLARGAIPERGARPCVGLITLDEYLASSGRSA